MATPPRNRPGGLLAGCMDDSHQALFNIGSSNHQNRQPLFQIPNVSGASGAVEEPEEVLTSEFQKLSVQEQARALDDLNHASGTELKEDPAIVDQLLQDFEHEVEQLKSPIYEQALKQDSSYVEDPAFRLKFLRANLHNVKKATKQMLSFLHHKATYFGSDKIASDITLDDLTPEELKFLLSGRHHIQDGTDRNGRVIVCSFPTLAPTSSKVSAESMIRVIYYIWFNILIPIPAVQKHGLLVVFYDLGNNANDKQHSSNPMAIMQVLDFMASLPIRYSANHFCVKRVAGKVSWSNILLGVSMRAMPKQIVERARTHYGSDTELQYELANYGIPLDTFPVDMNGNLRTGILNAWFYKHLEKEGGLSEGAVPGGQEEDDEASVSSPGRARARGSDGNPSSAPNTVTDGIWETDVLLGRGRLVQYHPGNVRFREFLDEHIQNYQSLARNQRRRACADLARELMNTEGTRFLKQTETAMWVVCDFEEAVDKVAQFYRTRRRRDNNMNNNENRP